MKYITLDGGNKKLVSAVVVSTGGASGQKVVALDSNGKLDPSVIPDNVSSVFASYITETRSADKVLFVTDPLYHYIEPLIDIDVDLPDPALAAGRLFYVVHTGNDQSITVNLTGTADSVIIRRNRAYKFHSDGVNWRAFQEA